jgi:cell wall-associated NlpC family hydrolase
VWRASATLLLTLLVAGCASAPSRPLPPKAEATRTTVVDEWHGGGGLSRSRGRGDALADFALQWRGARYRYGGATPEGFDCSGLVFYAHRSLGLEVPRTSRDQADEAERIKPRKLRRGDLVFFRVGSRRVNHVAIYIGEHRFVHAPGAGKPVTINSLDDEFYSARFVGAGRYWDRLPE